MLEGPSVTNLSSVYAVAWYPHVNWGYFCPLFEEKHSFFVKYSSEENYFPVLESAKPKMKWISESAEPRLDRSWVGMELCKASRQHLPLCCLYERNAMLY